LTDIQKKANEIVIKLNARDPKDLVAASERVKKYAKDKYGVSDTSELTEQKILEICAARLKKTPDQLLSDPDYARVIRQEREKIGNDLIKKTAKELGLTEAEVQILTQVK